jgi:type VI secretion system secreted protein VgrG
VATLELSFASGEESLSVRRFAVREAASSLFSISLWARSPDASLDLEALVGQAARFRVVAGTKHALALGARAWAGVVSYAEQLHALQPSPGEKGLSTYHLRIVPSLWLLTQRRGNRIYQHLSIPDIADRLLAEWQMKPVWKIERSRYPKLEYKVQYGESDYTFLSRLLEEAGVAFTFVNDGEHGEDGEHGAVLTFSDHLEASAPRAGAPIPYVDNPSQAAEREYLTKVRLGREVRPGAAAIRDYDFRNPAFALFGEAPRAGASEDRYEQYHYDPGAFLVETGNAGSTPVADDKGLARRDQSYGRELAERGLHGERVGVRGASFEASTFDLAPGVIFSVDNHPHPEITESRRLLVLESSFEGSAGGEWTLSGYAVFADAPYRPPRRTPKPIVHGFQSAMVVGPKGQEIHTDEFGRVRVQLHWDREGAKDEDSSCWMHVNQGWGGMGYGMIVLPRIGQEVLVGFLEGDPDHPAIMGRVYNALQQVPYRLPEHKTRSAWKSDSSLGSGGFNEIMFEDLEAKELVWQQAEKDRQRLVNEDEFGTVGHDRQKLVKNDESERTEGSRKRWVGKDADGVTKQHRRERDEVDVHVEVRGDRSEQVDGKESLTVVKDLQERVDGRLALRAKRQVHYVAGEEYVGEGGSDVTVKGPGGFIKIDAAGITIEGTKVKINVSGSSGKGKGSEPEAPEEPAEPDCYKEQLRAIDTITGEPIVDLPYRIELEDGSVVSGRTDEEGKTRRVVTTREQHLKVFWDGEAASEEPDMDAVEGC